MAAEVLVEFPRKISLSLDVGMCLCAAGGRMVYEFSVSIHASFSVMGARSLRLSLNHLGRPYFVWFGFWFFFSPHTCSSQFDEIYSRNEDITVLRLIMTMMMI